MPFTIYLPLHSFLILFPMHMPFLALDAKGGEVVSLDGEEIKGRRCLFSLYVCQKDEKVVHWKDGEKMYVSF